jgi:hypothetical protein
MALRIGRSIMVMSAVHLNEVSVRWELWRAADDNTVGPCLPLDIRA